MFKVGDKVKTIESQYVIGSVSNPIKTGTVGIVKSSTMSLAKTIWVDFSGDLQCVYLEELEPLSPLEKLI